MPSVVRSCGYDPDVTETGTIMAPPRTVALPSSAFVQAKYLPPPGAQGTKKDIGSPGTCAAWASTYGLATFTASRRLDRAPTDAFQQASPANIYVQQMKAHGLTGCQDSQLGWYLDQLTQSGTPNCLTAPYVPDCETLHATYNPNATSDPDFRIPAFFMVDTNELDDVKAIVASGGALCYGTSLNNAFFDYEGPGPLTGPMEKIANVGHCMLIIGYSDEQQAVLIQNSFGTIWGSAWNGYPAGFIWMGYRLFQYLAQGTAFYIP